MAIAPQYPTLARQVPRTRCAFVCGAPTKRTPVNHASVNSSSSNFRAVRAIAERCYGRAPFSGDRSGDRQDSLESVVCGSPLAIALRLTECCEPKVTNRPPGADPMTRRTQKPASLPLTLSRQLASAKTIRPVCSTASTSSVNLGYFTNEIFWNLLLHPQLERSEARLGDRRRSRPAEGDRQPLTRR